MKRLVLSFFWRWWKFSASKWEAYSFTVMSPKNELDALSEKYGTDKGGRVRNSAFDWEPHNYSQLYTLLYDHRRNKVQDVFECGIGSKNLSVYGNMGARANEGASLKVWRDYFPNAKIIGVDIDEKCLFSDDRISTFQLDQTKTAEITELAKSLNLDFDLVVDDGLHLFEAGITLYSGLRHRMKRGSYYCIEDVHFKDLLKYQDWYEKSDMAVPMSCVTFRGKGSIRADNNMVVFGPF